MECQVYNETVQRELETHYRAVLTLLGEDTEREGLQKTPYRVAKAMQTLTRGYAEDPKEILNSAKFKEDCANITCCLFTGKRMWLIYPMDTLRG